MEIKVLGAGCSCCSQLYANVEEAVNQLGWDLEVEFIHDITQALKYEVLQMPALIIDEKVVSSGSDLSVQHVKNLLESAKQTD
ncbi:thioredoxin family protein [uncultured Parabacteroides sp.]|uniref:thioredoxin family protein n=1 Tax=uncultured Parabacteroides sp. TaxID=512312 RepID=UPI00261A1ECE|nr:thioredoxin family protein [uncultured Parabacteroides sp.]